MYKTIKWENSPKKRSAQSKDMFWIILDIETLSARVGQQLSASRKKKKHWTKVAEKNK